MATAVHGTVCTVAATGVSSPLSLPDKIGGDSNDYGKQDSRDDDRRQVCGNPVQHGNSLLSGRYRIEDLLAALKKKEDEKEKNTVLWVLAIIGAVAAVAGIAFAVYRFFSPDYLDDFEDDFEDEFDNDFFEDEDDEPAAESKDASADKTED